MISRSPALSILFGILSIPGADWDGNLKMAFLYPLYSWVGLD